MNHITVSLSEVTKSFGQKKAVDRVSFDVQAGEIFGLLGPNGAGKTSIARLILGILQPDAGRIEVLGGTLDESKLERIGYLPEERGLYQNLSLERNLQYLANLKGLSRLEAQKRMLELLDRLGLREARSKKVGELSKGMQQKAQVIATLIHEPKLIILDEPFSALDPINTQTIKRLILELKQKGVSIILSTHQLNHAEELCDRILLIHLGKTILYGKLEDILQKYSDRTVLVRLQGELPAIPGVIAIQEQNQSFRLVLAHDISPQNVLENLVENRVPIDQFEIATPSLEQIFIRAVQDA